MIALFRATRDLHAGDAALVELVERLRAGSGRSRNVVGRARYAQQRAPGQKLLAQHAQHRT